MYRAQSKLLWPFLISFYPVVYKYTGILLGGGGGGGGGANALCKSLRRVNYKPIIIIISLGKLANSLGGGGAIV